MLRFNLRPRLNNDNTFEIYDFENSCASETSVYVGEWEIVEPNDISGRWFLINEINIGYLIHPYFNIPFILSFAGSIGFQLIKYDDDEIHLRNISLPPSFPPPEGWEGGYYELQLLKN